MKKLIIIIASLVVLLGVVFLLMEDQTDVEQIEQEQIESTMPVADSTLDLLNESF